MIKVIPATIPINKRQLEDEINLFSSFSDNVQVDICDGLFTKEKTWPYNGNDSDYFDKLKSEEEGWPQWEKINIEIHLMIQNPENVLEDWIKTGITSVVAHIESTDNFQKIIDICKKYDIELGIALKPSTDISKISNFISQISFIQVMGSDALGHHKTELENKALEQIKKLKEAYPDSIIGVDIGVNLDTKESLIEAGATRLVSGSALLDAENPKDMYEELLR